MTTFHRNENGQYQLIDICKYKICISNIVEKFITHGSQIKYGKRLNNLYNSHNILFKHDETFMWYPTRSIEQPKVKRQEFTIHHFIYYLIDEAVKILKRRSKRYTVYEVYELIEYNMFEAYKIHLDQLFDKIYDYLYPTHNEKIISFILNLKNAFIINSNWLTVHSIEYTDFANWTKDDLVHYLNIRMMYCGSDNDDNEDYPDNLYLIHCIYNNILLYIEQSNEFTLNDAIHFVDFYKQTIANSRLKTYEEELIEKTWHPSRLLYCLDNEDKNDIGIDCV